MRYAPTGFGNIGAMTQFNPNKHHRRSIRLPGHDYASPGTYFVTICTYQRECLFGEIHEGVMQRNTYGEIVADEWQRSVIIRPGEIELGAWIVMPNHFHAIITLLAHPRTSTTVGAQRLRPPRFHAIDQPTQTRRPKSLSSIIGGFKAAVTKRINQTCQTPQSPVWQRNYYENIIRNAIAFQTIQTYIQNNPNQWELDQLHPQNPSKW